MVEGVTGIVVLETGKRFVSDSDGLPQACPAFGGMLAAAHK